MTINLCFIKLISHSGSIMLGLMTSAQNFSAFRTHTARNGDYVNSIWRQTCNGVSDGKGLIGIGYYQDQIQLKR